VQFGVQDRDVAFPPGPQRHYLTSKHAAVHTGSVAADQPDLPSLPVPRRRAFQDAERALVRARTRWKRDTG